MFSREASLALNRRSHVELRKSANIDAMEDEKIFNELIFVKMTYRVIALFLAGMYMFTVAFFIYFSTISTALPLYFHIPGTK